MTAQALMRKNTVFGLLAIIIWSFGALLAVELTSIPPFELLFFEFFIAFAIVLVRFTISTEKKVFYNFRKLDLFIASVTLVSNDFFYYSAFRNGPAAQVNLINYLWPTLLILFSSFLPNQKLSRSYIAACLFSLFGVYTLISPNFGQTVFADNLLGYIFALGSAINWALYSLYTRYRGSSNSVNCISWACGPAAVGALLIHFSCEKFVFPNAFEMGLILLLGVFQIGLAFPFWERGIKRGSVNLLGLASYGIPLISIFLLVLFKKADFELRMITATLIISSSPLIPLFTSKLKHLRTAQTLS